MNILHDEQNVAINDVVVGLRSEAVHLAAVADQAPDPTGASRARAAVRNNEKLTGGPGDVAHGPSEEAALLDEAATAFRPAISRGSEAFVFLKVSTSDGRLREIAREARPQIGCTRTSEIVEGLIGVAP